MTDYEKLLTQAKGREETADALAQVVALRAIERLIGSVSGRRILVLACGDGRLTRWLATHGALVTGVDNSKENIENIKRRESLEKLGITYMVSDPDDLYAIEDSSFDDIICHFALNQVESLGMVIAEVARTIKLGGRFIFSVGHPCFEHSLLMASHGLDDESHHYFVEDLRVGFGGTVRHRTLATYINAVAARGFTVRRVVESAAEDRDVADRPEYLEWRNTPVALAVEAVFPHL